MPAERRPKGARLAARYFLLCVVAFVVLFPIYTTVIGAFKPPSDLLDRPLVPGPFTLDMFRDAWTDGRLGRYLVNSLIVASIITIGQLVTSVMSGYAFSMLEFPGRNVMFVLFISTMLVPLEATLVVNRRTVGTLGWINSYQGLAIPFVATAFGTFLVRQAFLGLPRELRDAARIDGAGHLAFLWHVAVPVVRPTLGALALFSFLSAWNQYLWPNLITTEDDMNTVQSGLKALRDSAIQQPGLVMAGTIIAAVPIAIALLIFQKALIRGLASGAVKG
jgi:sn-glycerol 3-phosphate transport system permease protein